MNIDTLSIARALRAAKLPSDQAEAIAAAIGRAVSESSATKGDLDLARAGLEVRIEKCRSELKSEIEQSRGMMNQVRAGLETKIEQVRTEVERARHQTIIWVMSSQVTIAGLLFAFLKL